MNLFGSLLLFLGGILLISIVTGLGRLLSRGRGGIVTGVIIPALVIVLIIGGGSFYLDHNGDVVTGTLESKHEDVITYDTGIYQRSLFITVQFRPGNTEPPTSVNLDVDGTLFDQLHNGESVQVRYINPAGLFLYSRLVQQNTLSLIAVEFPWATVGPLILAVSLAGIVVFAFSKRRPKVVEPGSEAVEAPNLRKPIAFVLFLVWLVVFCLTVFQPALTSALTTSWQAATAQVKSTRHYTEITQSNRTSRSIPLIQNFDIVEFTFTPQGSTEPVVGVDAIDSMSNLPEQGSQITIKYAVDNPRADQIPGSSYSHYWKNPLGGFALFLATIFALGLLWFMVRLGWKVLTGGLVGMLSRR